MRNVLFIECMGIERLTNVWGITRMFMGISGFFGTPIAAEIKNETGKYAYSFLYSGICFMVSSCVMIGPMVLNHVKSIYV